VKDIDYMAKLQNKLELIDYLSGFLTEDRINKIKLVLNNRTRHFTAVLEDIYHAPNASAIIRTCDCFGIQDLHIIENIKRNKVNKCVTQGSGKWISLHNYRDNSDNTLECIKRLKDQGYHIAATSLRDENDISIDDIDINQKTAICFGTEETGLSDTAHELADSIVKIPMFGFTQSFNISVTAAICLHNLIKRVHKSDVKWQLNNDELIDFKLDWIMKSIKNVDMILKRYERLNFEL